MFLVCVYLVWVYNHLKVTKVAILLTLGYSLNVIFAAQGEITFSISSQPLHSQTSFIVGSVCMYCCSESSCEFVQEYCGASVLRIL